MRGTALAIERRRLTRRTRESGISTVEVVIALPLLVALMLFMIYLGIKANLIGQVQSAADDAARMGSAQHAASMAQTEAADAANADLGANTCDNAGGDYPVANATYPQVDTSGAGAFVQSGEFTATVTCTKDVLGITVTVVETGISPIDTYRETTN
jgi:Flp pilus assembly protein TadG